MSSNIQSLQDLIKLLSLHNIKTDKWVKGPDQLYQEITKGECSLCVHDNATTKSNQLIRLVKAVEVRCLYVDGNNRHFELIEERQEFKNGITRLRNVNFVAEKLMPGEEPSIAATRALSEELQIHNIPFSEPYDIKTRLEESKSYLGLVTEYTVYHFKFHMTDQHYRQTYEEHQPDKTTYFSWKLIE